MEFIGEGTINHTPTDETVKVPVGSAFERLEAGGAFVVIEDWTTDDD